MKKLLYQLSALLFVGSLTSCEKGLMTYEGEPTIYFAEAGAKDPRVAIDSTAITFAMVTNPDSIHKVVVSVVGAPVNYDREYKLEVDPSSTAVLGTHFVLPGKFVMKKNALKDTIPVRLIRTPDMLNATFSIIFNLLPNENFKTDLKQRLNSKTNKVVKCITKKLTVTDVLLQPKGMNVNFYGPFSRKKLFLVCQLNGITPLYMDTMSVTEALLYAKVTQRYLNEQKALGSSTIIYEADGVTEMKMATAAQ